LPDPRSLNALNFLRQQGFKYLKSVKGGITAWIKSIDSELPVFISRRRALWGAHAKKLIPRTDGQGQ
jgi:hypothetical protein